MEHHCDFIENCVGFGNQADFVRLLIGVSFTTLITDYLLLATTIDVLINIENGLSLLQTFLILANAVVLTPISITILFMTFNQLKLVLQNRTSIENIEMQDDSDLGLYPQNHFDNGWLANVKEVLGDNPLFWMIPGQVMSGNGIDYDQGIGF
jgi:palmitoyltransferase